MADFGALAEQYMSSDNRDEGIQLTSRAAQAIHQSGAKGDVVREWVESVGRWVRKQNDDDIDLVAQAKGLRFLADTVVAIPDNAFTASQIEMLVAFFMSHTNLKTGVHEAVTALEKLSNQSRCKAAQRVSIVEGIARLGDDFNRQAIPTRLKVYQVLLSLLQNSVLQPRLQEKFNEDASLITDLLDVFHLEKEPQNLLVCFTIQRELLRHFSLHEENLKQIFDSFSSFFPISLRREPSAGDVTVEELKSSLRDCFAAHGKLAPHAFPFLLNKLDHGDALIVSVKLDILKTLQACVKHYEDPEQNIVPYIPKVWSSLKYEVRNGEVEESTAATLQVFQEVAKRLEDSNAGKGFCDLVYNDLKDDLQNPTSSQGAFRTLTRIAGASREVYSREAPRLLRDAISMASSKVVAARKATVSAVNDLLRERLEMEKVWKQFSEDDQPPNDDPILDEIAKTYEEVYQDLLEDGASQEAHSETMLQAVELAIEGVAILVRMRRPPNYSVESLICGHEIRVMMVRMLEQYTLVIPCMEPEVMPLRLCEAAVPSLRTVILHSPEIWEPLIQRVLKNIKDYPEPNSEEMDGYKEILYRLACVGCHEIPEGPAPIGHFSTLIEALLRLIVEIVADKVASPILAAAVLGVHAAITQFNAACTVDGKLPTPRPALWEELVTIESELDTCAKVTAKPSDMEDVYSAYLLISYSAVRLLYKSIIKNTEPGEQPTTKPKLQLKYPFISDGVVLQITSTATFVISQLDARAQTELKLDQQVFCLFVAEEVRAPSRLSTRTGIGLHLLSFGIIQGLYWETLAERVVPNGTAYYLLTEAALDLFRSPQEGRVFLAILTTLANRYQMHPGREGVGFRPASDVMQFWTDQLEKDVVKKKNPDRIHAFKLLACTMAIAAGFTARQEPAVQTRLAPLIPKLLKETDKPEGNRAHFQNWSIGEFTARQMNLLVQELGPLAKHNHAVLKPLYRQWAFTVFVKPLITMALAPFPTLRAPMLVVVANYRTAVLELLQYLNFSAYEADKEDVARVLLGTLASVNTVVTNDMVSGLKSVAQMLKASPETMRVHLQAVVKVCVGVIKVLLKPQPVIVEQPALSAIALAIDVLSLLSRGLSEPEKTPLLPTVNSALRRAGACSNRTLRRGAMRAREKWQ